ncbi:MAG TPA: sigma-70 family RNA polymerase sigma factor [Rhizobacter sp.]|nr:sigma-70 family RNA polymerase sigma factor [Rhizobacter sp.]
MFRSRDDRPGPEAAPIDADEPAERRLIGRIAARDLHAFEQLYRAYRARLTRFLDRMTRHSGLIEEVLNDTMLVVWNRAERFDGSSKVSTWIFAIAYRKALKALQRQDEAVEEETPDERSASGAGPEQQAQDRQVKAQLVRALDALSVDHRTVVELTYFHGMGYREIAQIVDCPVDTVKTRMFHARRRLRGLLAGNAKDWL